MKRLLAFCSLLAACGLLHAQSFPSSAKTTGPDGASGGGAVAVDATGAVYTTGSFYGTVDFDPGTGVTTLTAPAGGEGWYISKLDAAGNFVWVKGIISTYVGARPADISLDASGNVFVTGYFFGSLDFDPGPGTDTLRSPASTGFGDYGQAFILKLDAAGTYVWAKIFGGVGGEEPRELESDGAGNMYVTGNFYGIADFDPSPGTFNITGGTFNDPNSSDAFVMSLNSAGAFRWANSFGGTDAQEGRALAVTAAGNVYSAGVFANTTDLDPGPGTSAATAPAVFGVYFSKLDSTGAFVWGKFLTNAGFNGSTGLSLDASENIVASGHFYLPMDFDPGSGTATLTPTPGSPASQDVYFLKLNSSGDFVWVRSVGGPPVEFLTASTSDAAGNVYATGTFSGTADFDPGAGTFNLTTGAGKNLFVVKLDAAGAFSWAARVGDTVGVGDVAVDAAGTCYLTGAFASTVDFDPGAGVFNLATGGGPTPPFGGTPVDAFVLKLSPSGGFEWARKFGTGAGGGGLDMSLLSASSSTLTLAPNPATGVVVLRSDEAFKNAYIRVINVQGQTVTEWGSVNGKNISVDVSAQPAGVYVVEVVQGSMVRRVRLVKE